MNIFDYITPKDGEDFTTLLEHKGITIKRIVSSDNIEPKSYMQEKDEWVVVLEGKAILEIEGKERKMSKGDYIFIPAKSEHKVIETKSGTLWLAICID